MAAKEPPMLEDSLFENVTERVNHLYICWNKNHLHNLKTYLKYGQFEFDTTPFI